MKKIAYISILVTSCLITTVNCISITKYTLKNKTIEQLENIIGDPETPDYQMVVSELGTRGEEAALVLSEALLIHRRDSYLAGVELIRMGDGAKSATPILITALKEEREIVRAYALFTLGRIGEQAKCALPMISEHLWDPDPGARALSAGAMERITGFDLVEEPYHLDLEMPSTYAMDTPEGTIVQFAREWWVEEGQYMDWDTSAELCEEK